MSFTSRILELDVLLTTTTQTLAIIKSHGIVFGKMTGIQGNLINGLQKYPSVQVISLRMPMTVHSNLTVAVVEITCWPSPG